MNRLNKRTQEKLLEFLHQYGEENLLEALDIYGNTQQKYICKTKASISKVNIYDINYIKIRGHHMEVNTSHGTYSKYGSLSNELITLSDYGFIRCSHHCIVSLSKIKQILHDEIVLTDNTRLHISRSCISSVLLAYSQWGK